MAKPSTGALDPGSSYSKILLLLCITSLSAGTFATGYTHAPVPCTLKSTFLKPHSLLQFLLHVLEQIILKDLFVSRASGSFLPFTTQATAIRLKATLTSGTGAVPTNNERWF